MPQVYISLGSNIDPQENIRRGVEALCRYLRVTGISTVYRTAAIGRAEQADFYNAVAAGETEIPARELKFSVLRKIEAELGRVRGQDKSAARTVDLDLAIYGDLVIDEPDLKIPDPDIYSRGFLAAGLAELAPQLVLPESHIPIRELALRIGGREMEALGAYTESIRCYIRSRHL